MAIGKFNSLTFGGIDSADYGIFISGEGVFNAPERAVEMIKVPGRNGAIALDQGRYENIDIEYPSGTFGADQTDFRVKLRQFVSALKAQIGYQRLSDTYHPDEYRMGIFIEAVEVEPANINTAGEFKLIFNCKPQRWLTSGEETVTLFPNEASTPPSVINPTLFDSEPLFAVGGYGTFDFGNYTIDLHDPYRGEVTLIEPQLYTYVDGAYPGEPGGYPIERCNPAEVANTNDDITIKGVTFYWLLTLADDSYGDEHIGTVTVTDSGNVTGTTTIISRANRTLHLRTSLQNISLSSWPTTAVDSTHDVSLNVSYTSNGSHTATLTKTFHVRSHYLNSELVDEFYTEQGSPSYYPLQMWEERLSTKSTIIDSTVWVLGTPTYVDCEIGECYMISGGEVVSLNDHIDLGSDLPKLKPGETTFTAETSITQLDVVPRWWQL